VNAAAIVSAYEQVARRIMLPLYGPASCIAATRITCEVLELYGIRTYALPVKVVVECKALNLARAVGFKPGELKARQIRDLRRGQRGWNGHLIAVAESDQGNFLIDGSFDQFGVDGVFAIEPHALVIPLGTMRDPLPLSGDLETSAGDLLNVRYLPLDDDSYRTAPAWETDHLAMAINMIVAAVEKHGR
jgi:hypothetical protein